MRWHKRATLLAQFVVMYYFLTFLVHGMNQEYNEVMLQQSPLKDFSLNVPIFHGIYAMPSCFVDGNSRLICGGWRMEQDH